LVLSTFRLHLSHNEFLCNVLFRADDLVIAQFEKPDEEPKSIVPLRKVFLKYPFQV